MAFNVLQNMKNDMIKYLQSLGLSFGGDLNAIHLLTELYINYK